jgi:PPOX class probable F420-dependent enzyme
MRKSLNSEQLGDLLSQSRVAILATQLADGSTLLAPVWHEWKDGGFTIVIDGNDPKMRNVRRDRRVSVMVAEDDPPYRGIEVRGEAKFVETAAEPILRRLAERYLGTRDAEGYLERMREWTAGAKVIRVEPGVLRAWDFADEEW